jgi:hypothetical protein
MRVLTVVLAIFSLPALADEAKPEIARPTGAPQVVGAVHTVRTIPEACVRLEGVFTGDAALPYRFTAVKSAPNCQPRARLVDFARAKPSGQTGWKFNDLIRIPSAACPSLQAVARIWRKPGDVAPPALDAQGRSRIYLDEARKMTASRIKALPAYAIATGIEGKPCR